MRRAVQLVVILFLTLPLGGLASPQPYLGPFSLLPTAAGSYWYRSRGIVADICLIRPAVTTVPFPPARALGLTGVVDGINAPGYRLDLPIGGSHLTVRDSCDVWFGNVIYTFLRFSFGTYGNLQTIATDPHFYAELVIDVLSTHSGPPSGEAALIKVGLDTTYGGQPRGSGIFFYDPGERLRETVAERGFMPSRPLPARLGEPETGYTLIRLTPGIRRYRVGVAGALYRWSRPVGDPMHLPNHGFLLIPAVETVHPNYLSNPLARVSVNLDYGVGQPPRP